jgi:hypothetical protein
MLPKLPLGISTSPTPSSSTSTTTSPSHPHRNFFVNVMYGAFYYFCLNVLQLYVLIWVVTCSWRWWNCSFDGSIHVCCLLWWSYILIYKCIHMLVKCIRFTQIPPPPMCGSFFGRHKQILPQKIFYEGLESNGNSRKVWRNWKCRCSNCFCII